MAIPKTVAQTDVRVTIDRAFSIVVPAGMTYSTDKSEINANRQFVFISTEENELYQGRYGDEGDYSLADPFAAPRCLTLMDPKPIGGLDLTTDEVKNRLMQMARQLYTALLGESMKLEMLVEREDVVVICAFGKDFSEDNAQIMVVTPGGLYSGQIWINDLDDPDEAESVCRSWLSTVEGYRLTEADKVPAPSFEAPTYAKGKRAQVLALTFAVPDGMVTLEEEAEKAAKASVQIAFEGLKQTYDFLAITEGFEGGFADSNNAPICINVRKGNAADNHEFASLWKQGREAVMEAVTQLLRSNMSKIGFEGHEIVEKVLGDKCLAAYTVSGESTDEIEYWRRYMVIAIHDTCLAAFNIFINAAKADADKFHNAIDAWVDTIAPATAEATAAAKEANRRKALAGWLAEDGKIDAIKVSQMFSKDVVFNNDNEIIYDGKHHTMIGMQFNATVIDDYPQIKQNFIAFGNAIKEVVAFVERNEHLMVPADRFHKNLLAATRKRPITGISVFDLCAWHLITIVETSGDEYMVALGQDLIRGLPQAYKFVAEFIKTLREYNGKTGPFKVSYASTMVLDSPCDYIETPVAGSCVSAGVGEDFPEVSVAEGEHPYAGVLDNLDKAVEEEKAAYEQSMKLWQKKKERVERQRQQWVKQELDKLRSTREEQAKGKLDRILTDWQQRLEQSRQRRAEAERTLAGLGWIKLAEKKAQRQIIERCSAEESECAAKMARAREDYAAEMARIDRHVRSKADEFEEQAEEQFPMPAQPKKPESVVAAEREARRAGMTEIQRQNEDIKEVILEVLSDGCLYSVEELQYSHPRLESLSNQRVSALTRQLVTEGLVERVEERRKAYFRII